MSILVAGGEEARATRVQNRAAVPRTIFFLSTFCQRLGLWISGYPFPVAFLFSPFIIAYAVMRGSLQLSFVRGLLFSLMIISFATSLILGRPDMISAQSALLFAAMYAPWVLWARMPAFEYRTYVRRVAFWVGVFSVLAAVQYIGQFAYHSPLWFSWRGVVPETALIEYNTLNEMSYGSGVYKGNGFFLLEPSTLSGLIARVFLLTVIVLGELKYAVPFSIGLLFAFSGTGIIFTVAFTAPLIAILLLRRFPPVITVVTLTFVALALAFLWMGTFVGDYFSGRLAEFSDPRASGYARFTSTLVIFERFLTRDVTEFLVGYGPGSYRYIASELTEETFGSGWIKLFIEYGLFGLTTFSAFFLYCVYTSTRSLYLSIALLAQYLILDGGVLVPQLAFLSYAIFVLPVRSNTS
jgi:hypothetical protein